MVGLPIAGSLVIALAVLTTVSPAHSAAVLCEKQSGTASPQASRACMAEIRRLQADKTETACTRPVTPALLARYRQDVYTIQADEVVLGWRIQTWNCPAFGCGRITPPLSDDLVVGPACQPPACIHLPAPSPHALTVSDFAALCPGRHLTPIQQAAPK